MNAKEMLLDKEKSKAVLEYARTNYYKLYMSFLRVNITIAALALFAIMGVFICAQSFAAMVLIEGLCLFCGCLYQRSLGYYWQILVFLYENDAVKSERRKR